MQYEQLGISCFGRPISMLADGCGARHVLFCAAHHGSEWITACVLRRFLAEFAARRDWRQMVRLYAVPCVNPDGAALSMGLAAPQSRQYRLARRIAAGTPGFPQTWKANGRGVDLNLNYPAGWARACAIKRIFSPAPQNYPGPHPLSEPECRAMAELAVFAAPDVLVTLHAQGGEIYWQYGGIFVPGAQAMGEEMARRSGYCLAEVPPESAYAGYKDWFIQEYRRPAYTVECGKGENPLPLSQLDAIYASVRPILETALCGIP